jgi:glycosyltransferase involved in cell wall biosynthesis
MMSSTRRDGAGRRRVLLVSHDVLGGKMAGPGIRNFHLSRVLAQHVSLTLAILPQDATSRAELQSKLPDAAIVEYIRGDWESIREAAEWAEVIIISPDGANDYPELVEMAVALVIDGYDPLLVEWLAMLPDGDASQHDGAWAYRMETLLPQYLAGDYYICASERQRYWWLGKLEVAGRLNAHTFMRDPSLRNLIDIVPYGLPETPPRQTQPVVRGVWPGIEAEDRLLLWGGGLWSWLDPLTAVKAVAQIHITHPNVKLIFPGTVHPNIRMQNVTVRTDEVYTWVEENNLLDRAVFFGDWLPYGVWPDVLLESDLALSLHHDTIETQLAYRSRVLEYIWAGLPVIATKGDATSELISEYNVGRVVDYSDVAAVSQAIMEILDGSNSNNEASFASARRTLTWENAARPLVEFCLNPRRAADRPPHLSTPRGVTYYQRAMDKHEAENARLKQLVAAYERGKFIRLMRAAHRWRNRLAQR